jgi:hypothetical protein
VCWRYKFWIAIIPSIFIRQKKVIILTYMLIYCSSFGSSIEDEEESEGQEGYNDLLIFSRISAIAVLMGM